MLLGSVVAWRGMENGLLEPTTDLSARISFNPVVYSFGFRPSDHRPGTFIAVDSNRSRLGRPTGTDLLLDSHRSRMDHWNTIRHRFYGRRAQEERRIEISLGRPKKFALLQARAGISFRRNITSACSGLAMRISLKLPVDSSPLKHGVRRPYWN